MDTDFEEKCQEISKKRKERKHCPTKYLPPYINTPGTYFFFPICFSSCVSLFYVEASLFDANKEPPTVEDLQPKETAQSEEKPEEKQTIEKSDGGKSPPQRKRKRFKWQKGYLMKKKKKRLDTSQSQVDFFYINNFL